MKATRQISGYLFPVLFLVTVLLGGCGGEGIADINKSKEITALIESGDFAGAVAAGEAFTDSNPGAHLSLNSLGWAYLKNDQLDDAEDAFNRCLALEPGHDNALVGLGAVNRARGDLAAARKNYKKALAISPDDPFALSSLLVIELMRSEVEAAVEYGERAWAQTKRDPTIAANLAAAYFYSGDTKNAQKFYGHAERLGYHNMPGLDEMFSSKASEE